MPYSEITEVVLIRFNVVNNSYQKSSRVLYTFVPNKSFSQLLDISPKNFIFLIMLDSEFSYIEVSFTDQNSTTTRDRRQNKFHFSYQLKCKI